MKNTNNLKVNTKMVYINVPGLVQGTIHKQQIICTVVVLSS